MDRPADPAAAPAAEASAVARRLDDAARVCGRVAHDFDNVLMAVMGFAELAQAHIAPGSQPALYLGELLRAAQESRAITEQLHSFNRAARDFGPSTRLADVLGDAGLDGVTKLPAGVRAEMDLADDLPAVAVGDQPMRSILSQLTRNAAEAMSGGGRLTVSALAVSLPAGQPDSLPAPLPPGEYVELTVTDAGPGVRPDLVGRIGREPFVTTKPRHRGLGLPTVVRTLAAHGGGLRIESSPRGTAVVVYLPSADLSPPAPGRTAARAGPLEVAPP
ncbi:MAG TPA: ATP-binding protein [Gemmataceae bacterium]